MAWRVGRERRAPVRSVWSFGHGSSLSSFPAACGSIRAECPDERTDGSTGLYDQFLNFDDQNFSKARILQLSKDLGRAGTKLAHEPYPADRPERATPVLLLTAKEPLGSDEPGR